ncbi:SHOCT domain-containing protein [Desulfosporosinus sp. I2]|uniref:SHOCT domain-containing protein n=1 Tax=Desulfosporosinus sp. I2 TaxID=1617025 RepID=UPI0032B6FB77
MSKNQVANEVKYKVAVKLLDIMLRNGLISPAEYKKIDQLNRQTFSPELSGVYV